MEIFVEQLTAAARKQGFSQVGVCSADARPELARFQSWLDAGYDGQMSYLRDRRDAYETPHKVLEGVKSIVMLTMNYATEPPLWVTSDSESDGDSESAPSSSPPSGPGQSESGPSGRISRYAWSGGDYHDVIHARLKSLKRWMLEQHPDALVRGVVDTAPLLERDYARLAGIGWVGKNTMLIHKQEGSWFFLAALLTDLELPTNSAFATDHCGVCRACLDACPTDAFPEPYVLDATRCISYLTIELRDAIPAALREPMGDWVFGCDVCQDVCPWNNKHEPASLDLFAPRDDLHMLDLHSLFEMTDESFRERFRRTPLWRSKREGVLRNAAIVLGNGGNASSVGPLARGLSDTSPLVRGAAAWALGRIGGATALTALSAQLSREAESDVQHELQTAIASVSADS